MRAQPLTLRPLTLLLGSGFSIPFGMASVRNLTRLTRELFEPRVYEDMNSDGAPAAKLLYRALRCEYGDGINFELALHAIESLLPYCAREVYAEGLEELWDVRQVLHAFTKAKRDLEDLVQFDVLEQLREAFVESIVNDLHLRELRSVRSTYKRRLNASLAFIKALSLRFALRCFTLNYDTMVDRHLNWNDGFNGLHPASFSRTIFNDKLRVSEPLLCHLHGSINYGFDDEARIVKFLTPPEAILSYPNARWFKQNQVGELYLSGPIISGQRKLDKITATPYSYYYYALIDTLIESPYLLLVGYGCMDPHIDYWLDQHRTIHGDKRRVVIVTKQEQPDGEHRRSLLDSLRWHSYLRADVSHKTDSAFNWHKSPTATYFANEQILVVLSGYPLDNSAIDAVASHLNG